MYQTVVCARPAIGVTVTRDSSVLTANQLKKLAKERLKDAVELALKARICRHLRWQGFPETRKEFESYHSNNLAEWSAVAAWDPEVRYKPVSSATKDDADV